MILPIPTDGKIEDEDDDFNGGYILIFLFSK